MDPNRFKFDADDFYLKSAAEMRHLWRELPEACDNTLLIAERCEVSFTEGEGRYMPRFPVPEGEDETSWFIKEVETGLQRALPRRRARTTRASRRPSRGRHRLQGLPGLLPRRRRLHQLGQGATASGSAPAVVGRRLDVRRTPWASPTSTRCRTA